MMKTKASRTLLLLIVTMLTMLTSLLANENEAEKKSSRYSELTDKEVEFVLDDQKDGDAPRIFYLDHASIEKRKKEKARQEKNQAIWMAKKTTQLLARLDKKKKALALKLKAATPKLAQTRPQHSKKRQKTMLDKNPLISRILAIKQKIQNARLQAQRVAQRNAAAMQQSTAPMQAERAPASLQQGEPKQAPGTLDSVIDTLSTYKNKLKSWWKKL